MQGGVGGGQHSASPSTRITAKAKPDSNGEACFGAEFRLKLNEMPSTLALKVLIENCLLTVAHSC